MSRFTVVEEPELGAKPGAGAGEGAGEVAGEGESAGGGGSWWGWKWGWAGRARAGALAAAVALYVCALVFVKTMYLRGQRLHRLVDMAAESEQMMRQVQGVQRALALKLDRLGELDAEY